MKVFFEFVKAMFNDENTIIDPNCAISVVRDDLGHPRFNAIWITPIEYLILKFLELFD